MSVNWFDIQENTFRRWTNDELKRRGMHLNSLKEDLKDGLALINLLEIISGESLGRYNKHPRVISQKMENLNIALAFIQSKGIKLVNIGAEDIHNGNMRIILGLLWTLILRYEIRRGGGGDDAGATDDLLKWVQSKIPEYNIDGFTAKNWNDGRALCALVNAVRPGRCPQHGSLDANNKLDNCKLGIDLGESIGVDRLILPEELSHPKVDKLAVMTYIAQFRNLPDTYSDATRVQAYGPGLTEAIANTPTHFVVNVPTNVSGNIDIKITTDQNKAIPVTRRTEGTATTVEYTPTEPGSLRIEVTLDGVHIPGSVFTPNVLEQESLGGEGRIRVFYSTTSGTQKGREDTFNLQRLLESKKVHLRSDFEPWIAVDIMERDDREMVFRRAGTRQLPIVFIDDEYVGDFDTCQMLEDKGALDKMLNMEKQKGKLVSAEEHLQRLNAAGTTPRLPADLQK